MDKEKEPSIAYINLIPGHLFADLRQPNDHFCVKISDRLYSHQTSMSSLTRRLSEQPTGAHAFLQILRRLKLMKIRNIKHLLRFLI